MSPAESSHLVSRCVLWGSGTSVPHFQPRKEVSLAPVNRQYGKNIKCVKFIAVVINNCNLSLGLLRYVRTGIGCEHGLHH